MRRARRSFGRIASRSRSFFGGLPTWAKPSRVAAITGVTAGAAELLLTPIPNGSGGYDSWIQRLVNGSKSAQASGNPMDILQADNSGNDASTIFALQLKQNAVPAIVTVAGFGIGAAILRKFGL